MSKPKPRKVARVSKRRKPLPRLELEPALEVLAAAVRRASKRRQVARVELEVLELEVRKLRLGEAEWKRRRKGEEGKLRTILRWAAAAILADENPLRIARGLAAAAETHWDQVPPEALEGHVREWVELAAKRAREEQREAKRGAAGAQDRKTPGSVE